MSTLDRRSYGGGGATLGAYEFLKPLHRIPPPLCLFFRKQNNPAVLTFHRRCPGSECCGSERGSKDVGRVLTNCVSHDSLSVRGLFHDTVDRVYVGETIRPF